jgi:hypothetical protein
MQKIQIRHNKEKKLFEKRMGMLDDFLTRHDIIIYPMYYNEEFGAQQKIIDHLVKLKPFNIIKSLDQLRNFMNKYSLAIKIIEGREFIGFDSWENRNEIYKMIVEEEEEEEEVHSDDEFVYFTNDDGKIDAKYM